MIAHKTTCVLSLAAKGGWLSTEPPYCTCGAETYVEPVQTITTNTANGHQDVDQAEVARIFGGLQGDAKEVALLIMRRLWAGQHQYGRMNVEGDGKDYLDEIMEELVDAPVYGCMEFVKTKRRLASKR